MKFLIEPVIFYADAENGFPHIPCIACGTLRNIEENCIKCVAAPVS